MELATKAQIMSVLRSMDPVAATAAQYLADLFVARQDLLGDEEAVCSMAVASMARAIEDANLPGGASMSDLYTLATIHGEQIGEVAVAMAAFVLGKKRSGWVVTAVAAAVGLTIAALGG